MQITTPGLRVPDERLSRVKLARVLQFWSFAMQEAYVMSRKLTSWQTIERDVQKAVAICAEKLLMPCSWVRRGRPQCILNAPWPHWRAQLGCGRWELCAKRVHFMQPSWPLKGLAANLHSCPRRHLYLQSVESRTSPGVRCTDAQAALPSGPKIWNKEPIPKSADIPLILQIQLD